MKTIFRAVCFAAACTMATLTMAPAARAASPAPESVAVRYGDLDLRDAHDAQLMLRRVKRAADRVCGEDIAVQYRAEIRSFKACRQSTIAAAVVKLDAPLVSAHYVAQYGAPAGAHVAMQGRDARQPVG